MIKIIKTTIQPTCYIPKYFSKRTRIPALIVFVVIPRASKKYPCSTPFNFHFFTAVWADHRGIEGLDQIISIPLSFPQLSTVEDLSNGEIHVDHNYNIISLQQGSQLDSSLISNLTYMNNGNPLPVFILGVPSEQFDIAVAKIADSEVFQQYLDSYDRIFSDSIWEKVDSSLRKDGSQPFIAQNSDESCVHQGILTSFKPLDAIYGVMLTYASPGTLFHGKSKGYLVKEKDWYNHEYVSEDDLTILQKETITNLSSPKDSSLSANKFLQYCYRNTLKGSYTSYQYDWGCDFKFKNRGISNISKLTSVLFFPIQKD